MRYLTIFLLIFTFFANAAEDEKPQNTPFLALIDHALKCYDAEDYQEAKSSFEKAKAIALDIEDDQLRLSCLVYLYNCSMYSGNFEELQDISFEIYYLVSRKVKGPAKRRPPGTFFFGGKYSNSIDNPQHQDTYERQTSYGEANEHYERARDLVIQGIGLSIGAGISVNVPPAVAIQIYQGSKCFVEAAKEYNKGVECEKQAKK